MFLRTEILGLQNSTDILVLEDGIIYSDKDLPPIASFSWGTVNVKTQEMDFVSYKFKTSLLGEMTITVVIKVSQEAILPKRFNILAKANKGDLTVELGSVLISEVKGLMTLEGEDYKISKDAALTCYAESVRVRETGSITG